jgi:hypothetical protein
MILLFREIQGTVLAADTAGSAVAKETENAGSCV